MTKPIPQTHAAPLSFEQRLQLVKAEIATRVTILPAKDHNAIRARLWVRWINRAIQEVTHG